MAHSAAESLPIDPLSAPYTSDLRLTTDGRLVDFLHPSTSRPNTPEERVRQTFARKLHLDYGYPKSLMAFGAAINIGSETRYADIAVYRSDIQAAMSDQAGIQFVVETKAPDVTTGEAQLKSYIFGSSAAGGVWINETQPAKYFRRVDVPLRALRDWPNLPRYGEGWESVGAHRKDKLRPPHNLVETFRRCHNALYRQGIDSEDIAMDMVRIILAKYRDELNPGDECEFRCTPARTSVGRGSATRRRAHPGAVPPGPRRHA